VDWKAKLPPPLSVIQRYGLAALSVSVALGGALLLERFGFRDVGVPLFLFAVALSAWYGGTGAAALALVLSCVGFDYFFVQPIHSFDVSSSDLPYFIVFAMFALLVTWFSAVRRRVERDLRQARDELKIEVAERTQQASLLNLTHDTIFVRDMRDVITYWNRGAE
jgi:K+-sensing histidine kinase KdpD